MSWNNIDFDDVVVGVGVLGVVGDVFDVVVDIIEGVVLIVLVGVVVVGDGVLVVELAVYNIGVVKFDEVRLSSDSLVGKFEDVKFVVEVVVMSVIAMADEA